ncbi:MAG TPA: type II secretion system protein [Phycisphaerae bacterium]|nr:type II secretion system protein [Phycisphaerae bacterium]
MPRTRQQHGGRRAFTLLEALLAATVLAIAITAVMLPFTAGLRTEAVEARQTLAVSLAEELIEEVLSRPFEEPGDGDDDPEPAAAFGPDPGETTRDTFSAIDDYHGYAEPAGAIRDPEGKLVDDPAAVGLSRHVTVAYVYVSGQDSGGDPSFMRVVVEVRHLGEPLVTLTRLVQWLN